MNLICFAIPTESNFCSRYIRIHKVADGYWRSVWIAGVDSNDVIVFTDCHGTVACHVIFQTRLGADVYLHSSSTTSQFIRRTRDFIQTIGTALKKIFTQNCSQRKQFRDSHTRSHTPTVIAA